MIKLKVDDATFEQLAALAESQPEQFQKAMNELRTRSPGQARLAEAFASAEAAIRRAEAANEAAVAKAAAEHPLTSRDLEGAMMARVECEKQAGESTAQAFVRLAKSDGIVRNLYAAADLARVQEAHAEVFRKRSNAPEMIKRAEISLDSFVAKNRRDGETIPAAHARLSGDAEYRRIYRLADEARRDLGGVDED